MFNPGSSVPLTLRNITGKLFLVPCYQLPNISRCLTHTHTSPELQAWISSCLIKCFHTGTSEDQHVKTKILYPNKFTSTYHHPSNYSCLIFTCYPWLQSLCHPLNPINKRILGNPAHQSLKYFYFSPLLLSPLSFKTTSYFSQSTKIPSWLVSLSLLLLSLNLFSTLLSEQYFKNTQFYMAFFFMPFPFISNISQFLPYTHMHAHTNTHATVQPTSPIQFLISPSLTIYSINNKCTAYPQRTPSSLPVFSWVIFPLLTSKY